MATTTRHQQLTTVGADIEVAVIDFATPGMPTVWVRATVLAATPVDKLTDVTYRRHDATDKDGNGLVQVERIGSRGGSRTLRPVA